jgi:hypothetical protein
MAAALSLAFTPTPLATGEKIVIQATDQVSAGKSFMPRSKYKNVLVGAAASASPSDILSAWEAIYGVPIAGNKIFVRAYTVSADGFASTPLLTNAIIS